MCGTFSIAVALPELVNLFYALIMVVFIMEKKIMYTFILLKISPASFKLSKIKA